MLNIFEFSHVKESVELDWFMRKTFHETSNHVP